MTPLAEYGMVGALGAALILREVLPFLLKKNGNGHNGNGSAGAQPVRYWDDKFDSLAERNEKSFENALKILVIPVMTRTNEILEEMKESEKKLTEAILTLRLRDEAREFVQRAKGAGN